MCVYEYVTVCACDGVECLGLKVCACRCVCMYVCVYGLYMLVCLRSVTPHPMDPSHFTLHVLQHYEFAAEDSSKVYAHTYP